MFFHLYTTCVFLLLNADCRSIEENIVKQIKEQVRHELEGEIDGMRRELKLLKENNLLMIEKLSEYYGKNIELQEDSNATFIKSPEFHPPVAFSAYLSHHVEQLGKYQTVPFDKTETNFDGAFDTSLHVFNCPVTGVYCFQTSVTTRFHGRAETEIVKNESLLITIIAHAPDIQNGYGQSSSAVITTCSHGENVWVRVHDGLTHEIDGNYRSTTFSGFLLYAL